MRGLLLDPDVQITSLGNTPEGYLQVAKDLGEARRDPVMAKLMTQSVPVVYDQQTYAAAGAGEVWEAQAPYGYKTGIAVKLHLPGNKHFLLGVDREEALPEPGAELMQMIGGLQLLAAHALTAADQLLGPRIDKSDLPKLTRRELDVAGQDGLGGERHPRHEREDGELPSRQCDAQAGRELQAPGGAEVRGRRPALRRWRDAQPSRLARFLGG
jgi:hypothetical protein